MKLSPDQRGRLLGRFGGRCAYCGEVLGKNWQADHVEPLERVSKCEVVRSGRSVRYVYTPTGEMKYPERDHIGNLMPACVPCNNNKGTLTLAQWRKSLNHLPDVLQKNYSAWRHAHRFGLVLLGRPEIQFHFEIQPPTRIPRVSLLEST